MRYLYTLYRLVVEALLMQFFGLIIAENEVERLIGYLLTSIWCMQTKIH